MMKHLVTTQNSITYVYVLLACSDVGLVDKRYKYFNSMSEFDFIILRINHYACKIECYGNSTIDHI